MDMSFRPSVIGPRLFWVVCCAVAKSSLQDMRKPWSLKPWMATFKAKLICLGFSI